MALSKQTVFAKIEVVENGTIQVQKAIRVMDDDGSMLAEKYHRETFAPTTTLATLHPKVRTIAAVVWTPEVIAAYIAQQQAQQPLIP